MKIINGISADKAFEKFKQRLSEMDDVEFFRRLGTSIDELKEMQQLDLSYNDYVSASFVTSYSAASFEYLMTDAMLSQESIYSHVLSCDTFANSQVSLAS
jgi:hypothetical protein